jgi:ATP-dependent Clp protease protease subunit
MKNPFLLNDDDNDEDEEEDAAAEKGRKGLQEEVLKSRSIVISEPISQKLARQVAMQLLILNDRSEEEPIRIYINSPGGDADSGFGIYDMFRFVKAPVTTVVYGLCASAAVTIFLGAEPGRNFSLPHARFLLHQPSTGVRGDASDIMITAEEIEKTRERYNRIVSEVTGRDLETIARDSDRDFWQSAEEAREYGLVSNVVTSLAELD